jgi:uncharacterized membrane protein YfcA
MLRNLRFYLPYAAGALALWAYLLVSSGALSSVIAAWPAALTMVFGSFIGGASAEGGGAVAFPVFTLLLKIPPPSARNFSFAIQSVGMAAASMLILGRGIPIEARAVFYPAVGGIVGLVLGTYGVVPLINPVWTKLFFVSLWAAFGVGLWRANARTHRTVAASLPDVLRTSDVAALMLAGLAGGVVTSIFGNGIDLLTFCVLTLWYGIDERVATPTSVVLMSVITLCGTALHAGVIQDFGPIEYHAWLAAAPIVVIFGPIGAFVISRWKRLSIARLLYVIMAVQLVGAIYVLGASVEHLLFCGVVLAVGSSAMVWMSRRTTTSP